MEMRQDRKEMLDYMLRPAFWVEHGVICHGNSAAAALLPCQGLPVASLILSGQEEYAQFSSGYLHLQLSLAGAAVGATVIRYEDGDLFLPDTQSHPAQFQALALAAMQLRSPLAGLLAVTDHVFSDTDPKYAAHANHRLHQLLRIINNMSDAQRFYNRQACRMEYTEICGFLKEILEKADMLLENAQIRVHIQLPNTCIYTLVDREQIERAVYNLLSNAAKYSVKNTDIQVQLRQNGQRLCLSVTSQGKNQINTRDFYNRFLREPSLEDPAQGLGLGLALVQYTAANHDGVLLIDHPDSQSIRVTMTLAILHQKDTNVRSPVFHVDYAGDRDHGLLELADVLPAELYRLDRT